MTEKEQKKNKTRVRNIGFGNGERDYDLWTAGTGGFMARDLGNARFKHDRDAAA
jgi:hypothetical protein